MQPLRRFVRRRPAERVAFHQTPSPRRPLVAVPSLLDTGVEATALEEAIACRIRPRRGMAWRGRRYARGEILELPVMAGFMLHLCEVVEMLPGHLTPASRPMPVVVESTLPTPNSLAQTRRPIAA